MLNLYSQSMEQSSTPRDLLSPHGSSDHLSQLPSHRKSTKRKWEDDDLQYESDPSELKFSRNASDSKLSPAWLVKLPPYLTNHWKELLDFDDNEEIVIGTIKVKVPKAPDDDYNLESRGKPHNMYCWAEEEKDVPKKQTGPPIPISFIKGYSKGHRGSESARESKEATFRRPAKGNSKHLSDDWPYLLKASPTANKTSLVAKFQDELLVTPIRAEGAPTLHARPQAIKKEPGYMTPVNVQMNLLRPGTVGDFPNRKEKELSFTAAAPALQKPTLGRDPKDKAYRMNKDVLISSLYELFEAKEHWYSKEFREELFQPEAYLRQVLREIAIYNQNGPMAGTWELNSNSKEALKWMKAQKK
ncbi:transcription initiation factor IIF, beta subunit-domain-containing protein [Tuber indicum]|nr:transcription initiation factor IIF, beta subunit-domain-containing protein [Tuber indicum]